MTLGHEFAISQAAAPRGLLLFPALSELRAQGMPAARCARGLVCNGCGRAHTSIQVTPESPGIPHAMVLTAYTVLSPVLRAFWPPSPARLHANVTPASGCQDHTSLPSAICAVRYRRIRVHRIPPRERDDRVSPLCWDGTAANIALICISEKQNYFFRWGWTMGANQGMGRKVICPSGHRDTHSLDLSIVRIYILFDVYPPGGCHAGRQMG